jgi:hypothetical protein
MIRQKALKRKGCQRGPFSLLDCDRRHNAVYSCTVGKVMHMKGQ